MFTNSGQKDMLRDIEREKQVRVRGGAGRQRVPTPVAWRAPDIEEVTRMRR